MQEFIINVFYFWAGGFVFSFASHMLEMDAINKSEEMEDEESLTPTEIVLRCAAWPVMLAVSILFDEDGDNDE